MSAAIFSYQAAGQTFSCAVSIGTWLPQPHHLMLLLEVVGMAQQLDTSVLPRTGLLARNNFRVARHTTKIVLSSGHVPHQHRFTGILGLGCQSGFAFGHKTNMLMDGLGLCVSAAFGSNDLRFRETHQQLVGILGVP